MSVAVTSTLIHTFVQQFEKKGKFNFKKNINSEIRFICKNDKYLENESTSHVCDTDILTSSEKVCHIESVTFPQIALPADPGCHGNKMLLLHSVAISLTC